MHLEKDCPFCCPSSEDVIILETDHARVICDARPVIAGHVIVAPKEHFASGLDLDESLYQKVNLLQQEISRRIYTTFGEVGVYEHGRSTLCRFHEFNPGQQVHTHFHVVPVSFDLIEQSGYKNRWNLKPSESQLSRDRRYLYQEISNQPQESWASGSLPVHRHIVRTELQKVLIERGRTWIPLEAPADDHDETVLCTAESLVAKGPSSGQYRVIIFSHGGVKVSKMADALRRMFRLPVIDTFMIYRTLAWSVSQNSDSNVYFLLESIKNAFIAGDVFFGSPRVDSLTGSSIHFYNEVLDYQLFDPVITKHLDVLAQDARVQEQIGSLIKLLVKDKSAIIINDGLASAEIDDAMRVHVLSKQNDELSLHPPQWNDLRLNANLSSLEEIPGIIYEAWKLRNT